MRAVLTAAAWTLAVLILLGAVLVLGAVFASGAREVPDGLPLP